MPTIDQLAPATAASDGDELPVSQGGIVRKVTRAQVLAGVQPQVALASGTLLGRMSAGVGGPEQITVGANLSLRNGALAANAAPFTISSLLAGTVPAGGDLVPLGQAGNNTAVSYTQFMNGLAGVSNVDVSHLLVTPTGGTTPYRLGDLAANTLPLAGGTLTGALTLTSDPTTNQQAATKRYVDSQVATTLPKTGGTLTGPVTLAADPATALGAATKQYVDGSVATSLARTGGSLTGTLVLASDPSAPMQAATKEYVDTRLLRSGDTLTGTLTLAADPVASLQAATKSYVDTQVAGTLSKAGGTLTGPLTLPGDPAAALQAATKHYVDAQAATSVPLSGGAMSGALTLAADPSAALQAATKQYVDTQVGPPCRSAGGR